MTFDEALRLAEEIQPKKKNGRFGAYNREGTKPHFHYKHFNTGKETCIRFDCPRYFCHEAYHQGLSRSEIKEMLMDLDQETWEKLIDEWNEGRKENFVSNELKRNRPDYLLLPKVNPKDGKLRKEDRR